MDLPNIAKYSPHLAGVIKRASIPPSPGLDLTFAFALENGGWAELDFERPQGVPYNPRPARIALIIINEARVTDSLVLSAGMLATAHADLALFRSGLPSVPDSVSELAVLSLAEPELLIEQANPQAGIIACALHLDRARHRHLVRNPEKLLAWKEFVLTTQRYYSLAEKVSPELSVFLGAWLKRAAESERAIK